MADRYKDIPIFKTDEGKKFFSNPIYPNIPPTADDIYIQTRQGDRFDLLAEKYYNDSSLWWVISSANPGAGSGTLFPTTGIQLRIPSSKTEAIALFNSINENR